MKVRLIRKIISAVFAAAMTVIAVEQTLMAEAVFLKDGSIIDGTIISDAAASVTIRMAEKKTKQIPRSDIMRILYTELKMGKIYIQKRDGKGIVAYMVDEDRASYTFRKELYNPEEFTLKRSEVLFMAEKNPSGLQVEGVVGTDRVSLKWLPPYDEVKRYNVYAKKSENDKYELIDSTGSKSITLKNLSVKTNYYLIVTSVDREDYESNPSNELKITTSVKVDVQLKDGKVFKAYIVSEDKDGYTFRNDLEKPEDFVTRRGDILYITERYPSALRGKAGTDSIDLEWFPPYDPVSQYNIYIKKKGEDYQPLFNASGSSYSIKGLVSNTDYTIKVTALGKDNVETRSSNELKITTKNIIPDEPVVSSVIKLDSGEISITWDAANDTDGKVEKYRIYGTKEDKREVIAEIKKTEYTLKDYAGFDRVEVAAVDDKGDESSPSDVRVSNSATMFGFYPGVIFPIGKFGEMADMGYGGMLMYAEKNLLFDGFETGLGAGFYYLPGNDLIYKSKSKFHRFLIAPLLINTSYRFLLGDSFAVIPSLSLGAAYFNMTYMKYDSVKMEEEITENFVDPMVKLGLEIEYSITESFSVSLTGEYDMFIEISGPMQFASAGIGLNYRF
jgi:fibronectin type 3 domain-containing protein